MGIRLLTYLGLMYQELINTGEVASGDRLAPVLPMVVYRGERRWPPPLDVKEECRAGARRSQGKNRNEIY